MMISGVYICDVQGELLIERTYTTTSCREPIRKLIRSQLSLGDVEKPAVEDEVVWEVDGSYLFAVRKGRVLFLALTHADTFVPEVYEILHKIEAVLEAALIETTIENIKANSAEILIVAVLLDNFLQMLEHLIDFGMPLVPSVDALARIIKRPSFTQKIKDTFTSFLFLIQTHCSKAKSTNRRLRGFSGFPGEQEFFRCHLNVERHCQQRFPQFLSL
eukprot:TRINITY_DN88610_c1_g1_i1.p4 TRINITY_DN88610_c1_g1~~TRINITY_DN88610_c1_g1_i1.p4  ORF type:complete len:246 (+),score=18.96 TRINITY_DN88610_c1_g1_i1:88-738(+)